MADVKQIAETLVNLTVKEVNELATVLKEEYGIEPAAAAPVMVAGAAAGAGDAAVEQTEFDVILKAGGPNKLAVVKLVIPEKFAKLLDDGPCGPGINIVPFKLL